MAMMIYFVRTHLTKRDLWTIFQCLAVVVAYTYKKYTHNEHISSIIVRIRHARGDMMEDGEFNVISNDVNDSQVRAKIYAANQDGYVNIQQ